MRADCAAVGFQSAAVVIALAAALVWPRPGQAALMVPLGEGGLRRVVDWANAERAPLLALDSTSGRVISRISDNRSLFNAVRAGILPVATRAPDCTKGTDR